MVIKQTDHFRQNKALLSSAVFIGETCIKYFPFKAYWQTFIFHFLLKTTNNFCLIWETYSTHEATYIWTLDDIAENKLDIPVEEKIQLIQWLRKSNKITYLRSKPKGFKKIEHDYSGEDLGFKKWKNQLLDFLAD